jgi:hypothetical protein
MKNLKLLLVVIAASTLFGCGNYLYDNDISGTTWYVDFYWTGGSSGSEDIYFYTDGSTDWGGTWTQDGKDVSWTFTATATATYTGEIDGDYMSGTMSNSNGDTGTWDASKY